MSRSNVTLASTSTGGSCRYSVRIDRARRGLTAFAVLLAFSPTTASGAGLTGEEPKLTSALKASRIDLPMRFRGPEPAIDVYANGEGPFFFAIDTGGAGEARLDSSLAKKLNLQAIGKVRARAGTGGKTQSFDLVRLDSLRFSGAEFHNVTAMVRDYNTSATGRNNNTSATARKDNSSGSRLPRIDGILGFGLFSDYLLTLDYPAKQVSIEKGSLPKPDNESVVAFEMPKGVPVVELNVDQLSVRAVLDSGSMGGFLLPKKLLKKLPLGAEPKVVGKGKTVGGEFVIEEAPLRGSAQLGSHRLLNPALEFADFSSQAVIGNRVLAEFRLTFDQTNRRVRLNRVPPTVPR
jgi:predicted aspartyl protease